MTYTKLAINGISVLPLINSLYETEAYHPFPEYEASIITSRTYKPIQIDILMYKEGLKSFMGIWDFAYWQLTPTQTFDKEEVLSELKDLDLLPKPHLFGTQGILLRTDLKGLDCTERIWVRTNKSGFTTKEIEYISKGLFFTYIKGL